jgi:pimeloyl-ACP methyl ester carboxylesterase
VNPGPAGPGGQYASIGGLDLYFETHGTGPPLLVLHGSLMTIEQMRGYTDRLAVQRRVIAAELQAHGRTSDADRPLRYELLADDLAALLDQLGLAQADVFGYSLGAGVAMQLAIRHPARIRRLVAMSVTYDSAGLHPELAAAVGDGDAVSQLRDSPYHRAYQDVAADPQGWDALVRRVLELDRQPQHWPAAQIAELTAPVLLVVADNDIVRLEHAVDMVHLLGGGIAGDLHGLPEARLAVIPGTTHEGLQRRADWVVPMIKEFLESPGRPA